MPDQLLAREESAHCLERAEGTAFNRAELLAVEHHPNASPPSSGYPAALAYTNRGAAYANLGEYPRAIKDFDEALRLDPQLALAYTNRGATYRHARDGPSNAGRRTYGREASARNRELVLG